jgi:diketogulonate reductase-like aldo/keto reductase
MSGKMELKTLGASQAEVPVIGLGTWNYFGGVAPLRAGIEYGQGGDSEHPRPLLATKTRCGNFRRRDLVAAAERSLQGLSTDHIDLYQLHWPNYVVPIEETMVAMEDPVDQGKIRFNGVSNFSVRELRKAQAALSKHRIVSNQVRYSLVRRTIENGLLQYCQQNQITLIAYSPLATGLASMNASDPAGALARVAKSSVKTAAQVALNWLIAKLGVLAIPKAATVEHTIENCDAAGWWLSQADLDLLETQICYRKRGRAESTAREWVQRLLQLSGRRL